MIGSKRQGAVDLLHKASDKVHSPPWGLYLDEANPIVTDGQHHPRRVALQLYRDFPNVIWECVQISVVNQFCYDDTHRSRYVEGKLHRHNGTYKFDVILIIKCWEVVAERAHVIAEVYDSAHSRAEKMFEDFCETHHSQGDRPKGQDTWLIMFDFKLCRQ